MPGEALSSVMMALSAFRTASPSGAVTAWTTVEPWPPPPWAVTVMSPPSRGVVRMFPDRVLAEAVRS